ncbi:MAG TPA: zf-HC2 domain-containing protein [Longimicrobiales bacterium]|nr:zf-HC2 domain-containing protein [Longimicrobiales bacterium]
MSESILHPGPDQLEAYVEETLDEAQQAVLESHLLGCPRCQAELEEWRGLFAALSSMPGLEPSLGFADRIMAGVTLPQPAPARLAERVRRWLPRSTMGWALVTMFLALPAAAAAAAIAWIASTPWLSLDGVLLYTFDKASAGTAWLTGRVGALLLQSEAAQWLASFGKALVATAGLRGLGAAAALFGMLVVASAWILYQNLFRLHTRDANYATYSF